VDIVMVNTNGLRIAKDAKFAAALARHQKRIEIYLQFDGLTEETYRRLRGEPLLELKRRAVEVLGEHGLRTTLVSTLQADVNEHEVGALVEYGLARRWVTGVSFQPATYSGRHVLPEDLERRVTFPDVIRAIAAQTRGTFAETDFLPLPCAHPNCHSLTYAFRHEGKVTPLPRFVDARNHLDLLANGITFSRGRAKDLIQAYLAKNGGCGSGCGPYGLPPDDDHPATRFAPGREPDADPELLGTAKAFFDRALAETLAPEDVFRVTITSFLDAYNFDVRRVMKCCIHHVLPSGHVVPFCAYNTLYREGHVPLPALKDIATANLTAKTAPAAPPAAPAQSVAPAEPGVLTP
jgi:uncharacterized radical SAM superfamily Fe-S cluster-containing enzyme